MTTYIGIDVAKDSLSVAVPKPNEGWKVTEYTNSPDGIRALLSQLPDQAHCVLEATGSYSVLVTYMLTQAQVTTSVINPKQTGPPERSSLRKNAFISHKDRFARCCSAI
jgi:transposase